MGWLSNVLSSLFPPPTGLTIDEPDPIVAEAPASPAAFFGALPTLVSVEAVLYWEGGADRTLRTWLRRHTLGPHPDIRVGVSPVADFYHLPMTDEVLSELALRIARPGAVGRRVSLHVHEAGRIVLEWKPAFGPGQLLLSRHLPSDRVESFLDALGGPGPD